MHKSLYKLEILIAIRGVSFENHFDYEIDDLNVLVAAKRKQLSKIYQINKIIKFMISKMA
jgi:hypothetical protein